MVHRAYIKVLATLTVFFMVGAVHASTITITDKLGRKVTLEVPVKRAVVVISYELIPALNLWSQVAGVSRWAEESCGLYKAIVTENPVLKRPLVGTGSDVNVEAVLKLNPDVVITWTYNPDTIRFLEEKGIKVIGIYPESLTELYKDMRMHGRIFGKEKTTEKVISDMEKVFSVIRHKTSKIPENKKKKVLWLGGKPTSVACGIGIINDVFKMIGGINTASHIPQRNADVSIEQIIAWNPDVIFIWGNANYSADDILNNPQWRHVKAVREGRVYKAPKWSTWSPRLAPIALWMAMKTYPEYYRDVDMDKVIEGFYRKVFGIPYSKVRRIED